MVCCMRSFRRFSLSSAFSVLTLLSSASLAAAAALAARLAACAALPSGTDVFKALLTAWVGGAVSLCEGYAEGAPVTAIASPAGLGWGPGGEALVSLDCEHVVVPSGMQGRGLGWG